MTFPFPFFVPSGLVSAFPVVQGRNSGGTTAQNYNAPLPSSPQSGELLLCFCAIGNVSNARTYNGASGWADLFNASAAFGQIRDWAVLYKISNGTETVVPLTSSGASFWATTTYRISGAGTPQISTDVDTTTSTSHDPPLLTPSGGSKKYLWLTAVAVQGAGTISSAPTNFTDLTQDNTSGNQRIGSAEYQFEAASMNPGAWTTSSANGRTITVAVPPT